MPRGHTDICVQEIYSCSGSFGAVYTILLTDANMQTKFATNKNGISDGILKIICFTATKQP